MGEPQGSPLLMQVSDFRLGGRPDARLRLPDDKAAVRREEMLGVLDAACELARQRKPDLLIIPGRMWDFARVVAGAGSSGGGIAGAGAGNGAGTGPAPGKGAGTAVAVGGNGAAASAGGGGATLIPPADRWVEAVWERLASLAPLPVFLCPGDLDPDLPTGPWDAELRRLRGRPAWPDNVHVFRGAGWSAREVRTADGTRIVVAGCGVVPRPDTAPPRPTGVPGPTSAPMPVGGTFAAPSGAVAGPAQGGANTGPTLHVLLWPAVVKPPSRGGSASGNGAGGDATAGPAGWGWSYVALGGAPRPVQFKDAAGRVRAADTGGAASHWPAGPGNRGAVLGRLSPDGLAAGGVETVRLDRRRLREVRVDLSGAGSTSEIVRRIGEAAVRVSAGPDDMIVLAGGGLYAAGCRLPTPEEAGLLATTVQAVLGRPADAATPSPGAVPTVAADTPATYWHAVADWSAARPDHDLEALRHGRRGHGSGGDGAGDGADVEAGTAGAGGAFPLPMRPTVERAVAARLLERMEAAEDPAVAETTESALMIALEALRGNVPGSSGGA